MRNHFYPLDVLRFLAAFGVLAYHLFFNDWAAVDSPIKTLLGGLARYEPLAPFSWWGWVGVQVFFVISGFVIANSAAGSSPAHFLKGRILRLYPAVWVCATITLAAWLLSGQVGFAEVARAYADSMLLWIREPWIDGVYWSLAIEIVFYGVVFWGLVFSRFIRLAAIPWMLTALTLFYIGVHYNSDAAAALLSPAVVGKIEWLGGIFLMRYGAFFAVGMWLWMLSQRAMTPARMAGLALAFVLCLLSILVRADTFQAEAVYTMNYPVWAPFAAWLGGVAVVVAAALFPQRFNVRDRRMQAAMKRIGLMTYPLFLVHATAGVALLHALLVAGFEPMTAMALTVAAVLALAYAVSAIAEPRIRKAMGRALDRAEAALRRAAPKLGWFFAAHPDRDLPHPKA